MTLPPSTHADDLRERLRRQLAGNFTIMRELGGGGSARVFLATERSLGRTVVLKVLPTELASGIDAERFRREILIAARLQHPHLVPLLAAGSPEEDAGAGERPLRWFSMPFVEGQTLREHLEMHAPLPLPETTRLLRALASALAYAHGRGVMHRDIKPENILLSDGVAMIADFGVARALDDASGAALRTGRRLTSVSSTLGTPAYMAPEQITGALDVDHRADLYALGCVAYEMLTGAPPLARGSLRATMAAQVNDQPVRVGQLRPDVPAALDALIMRCLQKEAAQRPSSGMAIVEALDVLAGGVGSGARPALPAMPASAQPSAASLARLHEEQPSAHRGHGPLLLAIALLALAIAVLWGAGVSIR
ncbi:MAG: serine/threonine-protein kinase [Gemmatimonas sp.]|uniref:serine/threonine-protein kinase n=1 Tax=Gemmatimonas sp. TaxID=1962908 RepID=UPI00391F095B